MLAGGNDHGERTPGAEVRHFVGVFALLREIDASRHEAIAVA
jgi:hypothetical protein